MPKKTPKPTDKQKLVLPDNVVDLIGNIVKDINQVKTVVDDVHAGNFQKAVSDLLIVIGSIVNDLILPKVLPQSKASPPEDQADGSPEPEPEPTPAE